MPKKRLEYATIELGGVTYAVLREAQFVSLCKRAGVPAAVQRAIAADAVGAVDDPSQTIAQRIRQRRRAIGLTQAQLASAAEIRTETLNRIERGKTEPDFRTVRKLVTALKHAEAE